jgi:single-strand DNA-binding protein
MNETTVTLVGNVATEVKYRETASGIPSASFRLASTARRWDRERGLWVDAGTSFYTVWAWRWLAGNVSTSIGVGDPVVVHGRMRIREWEKDGQRYTTVEIDATALGHDLSRGTSVFRRASRAQLEYERDLQAELTAGLAQAEGEEGSEGPESGARAPGSRPLEPAGAG